MMRALDPDWAAATGDTDLQRLMRGLEVTLREGKPMSELLAERGWSGTDLRPHWVGLTMPREILYRRIESRIDAMFADGWLEEVQGLGDRGYGRDAPGLQAIGYRQIVAPPPRQAVPDRSARGDLCRDPPVCKAPADVVSGPDTGDVV